MFNILKDKDETYKNEYAQTIFAKGDLLRAQGKYNEAFENYYRGRLFALKNLDTCQLMSFTNRLGLIRYTQKDFLKAVTYFKQALKEGTFCGTSNDRPGFAREDVGTAKNKLAFMYLETGSVEKAGRLIDQLEADMKKREGRNEELVRAYRSLYRLKSLYLEKKGDLINAYRYLRKYNVIEDSLAISDSKAASVDMDAVFKQSEQEHRLQLMRRDNSMKTFYLIAVTVISIMVASILAIV
ncbi:hypothetical protein [Pedobacter sp. JY14-1]|uniref:hypothetical protein n=1 Tax=Pedobacter sp. JY14-1 TaxID=3034151 RepID=UPI0023E19557|nr:hypothetical protein [Pedobacter sp. JY14-1]